MRGRRQRTMVLEHLESGRTITSLEALREYGIIQLPKRIFDLREAGYPVEKHWITVRKRHGEKARIAEYRLRLAS